MSYRSRKVYLIMHPIDARFICGSLSPFRSPGTPQQPDGDNRASRSSPSSMRSLGHLERVDVHAARPGSDGLVSARVEASPPCPLPRLATASAGISAVWGLHVDNAHAPVMDCGSWYLSTARRALVHDYPDRRLDRPIRPSPDTYGFFLRASCIPSRTGYEIQVANDSAGGLITHF